jgi:GNAT superfamily N-acetyltransferase
LRLTLESGLRVEITGLVVDDKARRRGVGRLLVEQIEGWAKSGNCRVLGVSSNVLRAESHAFYESLGYLQAKTQHSYRKTLA